MKNIVFFQLLNDYTGSPKILADIIVIAKNNGMEVDLYINRGTEGFLSGINVNYHFFSYKRNNHNRFITFFWFVISQIQLFFKLIKYRKKDTIFYINTLLPFGAGLAGYLLRKKVIYHIHEESLRPIILKKLLSWVAGLSASQILYVSEYLMKKYKFKKIPQVYIYNALPKMFESEAATNIYVPIVEGKFRILMICSLKKYKGIEEFLKVAEHFENSNTIRFDLIISSSQNRIAEYFFHRTIPRNVNIHSTVLDTKPYYKKASLLLNLSRPDQWVETFGLTILEALAFGIPVIVPQIGGPAELVRDGKEGFLISCYDIEKIAGKIDYLSKNPDFCLKLSVAARKRANIFKHEQFSERLQTIING